MTKTDIIHKAILFAGYAPTETRSSHKCFSKKVYEVNGNCFRHYVWLLQGTIRIGSTPKFGDSFSSPMVMNYMVHKYMNA